MNGLPLFVTLNVEFFGAALAILLSFVALWYAWRLVQLQPNNFIWGFLFYFCIAMTAFSLSRGVGHMVRIVLVLAGQGDSWRTLSPFSGGFNTMLMISVAAVTIYYHKGLAAFWALGAEADKLSDANTKLAATADELQQLNSQLEDKVEERTRNLSKSEQKLRNFIENSKDIIYFCDQKGDITSINSSGREMLCIDPEPATTNFPLLFVREEDRQKYLTALQENGFVNDMEIQCKVGQGSIRHILLTASAVYDRDGAIAGHEGIGKDMTRLKIMTEHLINNEKMASVGQMAAGVAHEINTPLGIILGYTQLMMDDYDKDSEPYANFEVMERQTRACRRIVADLLKFSRQSESAKACIDVNTVIQEVLAVSEHTLNINNITVERSFMPELPWVIGDPEKLYQVFINLFNNAQDAMEDGGAIIVTSARQQDNVVITVRDTGSGIAEDVQNKIFDPFYTTKDVGKGTGLGLSVTYGILQEHDGDIEIESPVRDPESGEVMQGSAFHIRLPGCDPENTT
ncbi:MAG: nitrogen regulation protein NR(II) [Desulfopila sp.]